LWSALRPGAAPAGRHAHGRTIQLSQGQDRPPLMPEGAPPTAGVLRSQAALPWWWVGGIVHVASAGVNSLFHFCRNGIHSCIHDLPSFLHSCKRVSGSSETKPYGKGVAPGEYEEQPTLPRRSIFGKDSDERARIFNTVHVLFFPPEGLFAGKWLGTASRDGREHHCRSQLH
jgi:hypothetical protein